VKPGRRLETARGVRRIDCTTSGWAAADKIREKALSWFRGAVCLVGLLADRAVRDKLPDHD
jgi:hypothetical protein